MGVFCYQRGDDMNRIEEFAERVKREREKLGWTQAQLGEKVGVSPQTISAYEKNIYGKGKTPTLDNAILIAESLGVSLDYLCGRDDTSTQIDTLADIVKYLETLENYIDCSISVKEIELPPQECVPIGYDEEGNELWETTEPISQITLYNPYLSSFFSKQDEVAKLYQKGTIPEDFYLSWRLGEIGKLAQHKILSKEEQKKRREEWSALDDDPDLPF